MTAFPDKPSGKVRFSRRSYVLGSLVSCLLVTWMIFPHRDRAQNNRALAAAQMTPTYSVSETPTPVPALTSTSTPTPTIRGMEPTHTATPPIQKPMVTNPLVFTLTPMPPSPKARLSVSNVTQLKERARLGQGLPLWSAWSPN